MNKVELLRNEKISATYSDIRVLVAKRFFYL